MPTGIERTGESKIHGDASIAFHLRKYPITDITFFTEIQHAEQVKEQVKDRNARFREALEFLNHDMKQALGEAMSLQPGQPLRILSQMFYGKAKRVATKYLQDVLSKKGGLVFFVGAYSKVWSK